jgi:hypothetical protein
MLTTSKGLAVVLVLGLLCAAVPKVRAAEPADLTLEKSPYFGWHTGLNLRTDFGTHPIRIDGGLCIGDWDFILVLDPMFFTDGQHDIDLLAEWEFSTGWALLFGWRSTIISIADGHQWQQKSVAGMAARLPDLITGTLRAQWGFEVAFLWVKHGGGLPAAGISFKSFRHVSDHFNFGLFVRFEYASPI